MNRIGFYSNGAATLKDFADSVNAKLVMPTQTLLDRGRDCSDYRTTDVARTWEKAKKAAQPIQRIRRAK